MFRPADGHHQVGVQTEHIKEKFTSERDFFCTEVRSVRPKTGHEGTEGSLSAGGGGGETAGAWR
jgi:hypothetical protein